MIASFKHSKMQKIIFANKILIKQLSYTKKELIGYPLGKLIPE